MTGPGPAGELVSLDEAATVLGLHYMTVYRHVREGRLPAEQHGGRWRVRRGDLAAFAERPAPGAGRGRTPARWADQRTRLVERLLVGDLAAAWSIVQRAMGGGAEPTDVYLRLLGPAMEEVGDRWAAGTATVGDEHRATSAAIGIAGRLGPRFARRGPRRRGALVAGGAPGDSHQLPLTMLVDVMRAHGVRVVDLGANVPVESFVEAVESTPEADAVAVSVADTACTPGAAAVADAVRAARPGVRVLVGGPAIADEAAAARLGADGWARDALEALRLLEGA